jgi:5-methylcytosine-specific restriction endonuclease McrA
MTAIDMALYMKNRRAQRREKLIELSDGICSNCNATNNLEFNHIDRLTKLFVLSGKGLDKSWDKILKELDKCELLCNTCHLEKTREQYKNNEIRPWNDKKHIPYTHGTVRSYEEKACRCDLCKKAKKLYRDKLVSYSEVVSIPQ